MSEELLKQIEELKAQLAKEQEEKTALQNELETSKNETKKLKTKEEKKVPIKAKLSNKKQIEDYLFLYYLFLDILGVSNWSELKNLYGRDEHRKIGIVFDKIKHFSKEQIEEIVEKVNDYESELKTRYKDEQFEYTDYQTFSVLFSEMFLSFKNEIIELLKTNLSKAKELYVVDDEFDIDDDKKVAQLFGKLTKVGEINATFTKNIEEEKKKIITKDKYLKEVNKLAYYMATGSGKTVLLHTNILQSKEHFKGANFYVVVPTKELGKQHRKNLVSFGYKESQIGFIDDEKSESVSDKVNSMLQSPYDIKIVTVHQLSVINKRKTIFSGQNILFVDEGHKGGSSEAAWRKDRSDLIGENGFSFEYSATFSHAIKDDIGLLQEYGKSIVFDYPYYKFYNDGYGKKPAFEPKDSLDNIYKSIYDSKEKLIEISDDERYELFVKDILNFYYQKEGYYNLGKSEIEKYRFENPLKLIICSTVDDKNNDSKVVEVLNFLSRFSTNIVETNTLIKKIEGEEKSTTIDDIFKKVFNSDSSGKILEYKLNDKEVGLKVENSKEYFGVINVGNVSNLGRELADDKITGTLINDFFTKGDNETINIVIAARILIEGWDTQRISSLSLFDFGKSKGSLIVQLFGRGVRLHGSIENNLKRSGVYEKLEEFSVYGYDAGYLKTFIEESELDTIIKQKSITIKFSELKEDKLKDLRVIKAKNDFAIHKLQYEYKEEESLKIIKKVQYSWVTDVSSGFEINLSAFINKNKLYEDIIKKQKDHLILTLEEFEKTVDFVFTKNVKIKKTLKTNSLEMFYKIALKMITSYFEQWYKAKLKEYEFSNVDYVEIDENDKNLAFDYTVTASEEVIDSLTNELVFNGGVYEIQLSKMTDMFKKFNKKQFAIKNHDHLYNPLLIKHEELQISPDRLEESEVKFLEQLHKYWLNQNQETNITLLRNQKHIGFNGFYPDFIMWYQQNDIEHFIFLDPKGINNFNVDEVWEKISFSFEIKKIEEQLKEKHSNLRLHSFILATKTLDELAERPEIKNTLNFHITKKFSGKLVELSKEQIKEALQILNVVCVEDKDLLSKILNEILKNDVEQILEFVKKHLMASDASTKLQYFIDNFKEEEITQICTYATCKEEAIILFIYKEIFNNEIIFNEFCNALKEKQVKSLKDEFKDIGAGEILSEIGLEMIMDSIPYFRTGKKFYKLLKKKI
ncbi:DEAD/DEAH box helicase family protein [Aliarcobacter butzleri]|uniref:DEAD/DEAH box helicase family protein n=1 Tax=Aliarcobacter butzleri TaxID=28197 RepID=UPI001EDC19EB|nr:DEAD/DEAH box helicase family protein [Aliarcobacter butzleri]MCG3705776.1 DEAD/DEAH box helicase family protein [Aliarcobacter butzleri]